jgi:ribonuclease P protein component
MQKRYRLRKNNDFQKVFQYGKATSNNAFVLHVRHVREKRTFRFGICVSKKVGNAVVRNRIRRRVKETVRLMANHINTKIDIVCIVRLPALTLTPYQLTQSIRQLLDRAKIVDQKAQQDEPRRHKR